jgi:hypothetical protein
MSVPNFFSSLGRIAGRYWKLHDRLRRQPPSRKKRGGCPVWGRRLAPQRFDALPGR